jgi:hypothetical protein
MHRLTQLVNLHPGEKDKIIIAYLTSRAEWLKKEAYEGVITPKMIDQALHLSPAPPKRLTKE